MPAPQAVVAEAGGPPPYQPPLPEPPPASGSGWRNIFRTATGLMHRQPPGETPAAPPSRRTEPAAAAAPAPRAPREPTADERLDIPTFLRRQSN
jgi:hypothetical protein